jgi:fluoroacetyl-CoA thioesterase
MKNPFLPGDAKLYRKVVLENDLAEFPATAGEPGGGRVHPFYGTFALARDVEWACRLFVIEMKESDEEGIGLSISVDHIAPAGVGDMVEITATLKEVKGNTVLCDYEAMCGGRLIARGTQAQKILKKDKLEAIYAEMRNRE